MNNYEQINTDIAIKIMGWCECSIKNHNISIPEYSTDRNLSATIVEAIRSMPPFIINAFNNAIKKYMDDIEEQTGTCNPSDFLLFISPDDICIAALSAIQQYKEGANF